MKYLFLLSTLIILSFVTGCSAFQQEERLEIKEKRNSKDTTYLKQMLLSKRLYLFAGNMNYI